MSGAAPLSGAVRVAVLQRRTDGILSCALDAPASADGGTLRCRFPSGEVAAARSAGGREVLCTPPPLAEAAVPFSVLEGEKLIASGLYDSGAVAEKRLGSAQAGLRSFASMSIAYLLYTMTDGIVRCVVLLQAFQLKISAFQLAIIYCLYEVAGVGTNIAAGLVGSRWGLRASLLTGLIMQLVGIALLYGMNISWPSPAEKWRALGYIAFSQFLCGGAKDLTKLGGKTVSKLVQPDEKQSRLFKTVAFVTGLKNSCKGIGYFIGAASLYVSFQFALGVALALILVALPIGFFGLAAAVGKTARSKDVTLRTLLSPAPNIRKLSLARAFLFASRDLWFDVALPYFFRDSARGLGWTRLQTGASLAAFIIVYGQVQAYTPQVVLSPLRQQPANKLVQVLWNGVMTTIPAALAAVILGSSLFTSRNVPAMEATLIAALAVFCVVFAVNSSVHSYLIVRYSAGDKVAADVGFYYMSNAVGRFAGTLASGAIYQYASASAATALGYCFVASAASAVVSTLLTLRIDDQAAGLACGPCLTVIGLGADGAGGGAAARGGGADAEPSTAAPRVEEAPTRDGLSS